MIGKIWTVWAIAAALCLIPVYFMERAARKVDGASGWMVFGWLSLFGIMLPMGLGLVSLLIWLFR
ncbi:hypothetical protein FXN63_21300 [Pigmentiphaga aceris]|uniref:Uncharacterized protein n=1 Tax=Pigmentiphaga aceris TaxID=1940612 RepID=A0A5C0B343_9BURK|nr:hypothetical protein [Pigmentiphaga aceris]QEI08093.1 hypothetical protein FXN63_21300 [Pigmentiphaga aceris]